MRVERWFLWLAMSSMVVCLQACGSSKTSSTTGQTASQTPTTGDVHVTTVDLGNQIDAEKHVAQPLTTFKPDQTIYASVATDGSAPSATLVARWTDQNGNVVEETTETIIPTGPTVTEFHVSKPTGWPPGKYTVEILLNGMPAGKQEFEVK